MISMSLYGNALFPTALMKPPSRTYSLLPPPSAHELWHTLQVCLMQGTGLMWCHQHHWVFTFKTENSNAACGTGWEFLSKVIHFLAQNAGTLLTSLVITNQVGCSGNGDRISRHNAIRDVVFSAAQSAALAPSKETPGLLVAIVIITFSFRYQLLAVFFHAHNFSGYLPIDIKITMPRKLVSS